MTARAVLTYEQGDPTKRAEGLRWYPSFRYFVRNRAAALGVTPSHYAAIFAATSPTTSYAANITIAEGILRGERKAHMASHSAADRIMAGAKPLSEDGLRGPKVRAFYAAIMGHKHGQLTIDRWMMRVLGLPEDTKLGKTLYAECSDAIDRGADTLSLERHSFQAALWSIARPQGAKP